MKFEHNAERRFIDQLPNDHTVKIAYDILNKFANAQMKIFFESIEENLFFIVDRKLGTNGSANNIEKKEKAVRNYIEVGYKICMCKYNAILFKLKEFKFEIFGGAIRDIFLGLPPQDIDVRFRNGSAITEFIKFLNENNYIVDNSNNVSSQSFLKPESNYDTFKSIKITTSQNVEITFDLSTKILFDNSDVKTTDFTVNGLAINFDGWLISKIEKEASISQIIDDISQKKLLWCGSDTVAFNEQKNANPFVFVLTTGKFVERLDKMIKKNFIFCESQLDNEQCAKCAQIIKSIKLNCGHFYCIECLIKEYEKINDTNRKIRIDTINNDFDACCKNNSRILIYELNHSTANIENVVKKYLSSTDESYDEYKKKKEMLLANIKMNKVNCNCTVCNEVITIKIKRSSNLDLADGINQ
jgi:hypothetical protein